MSRSGFAATRSTVAIFLTVCAAGSVNAQPPGGGFTRPAPGSESGFATFQTQCTSCHGNPDVELAPPSEVIRAMPPERIYAALNEGGVMAIQGETMSDIERQKLAEFMSGRPLGSGSVGAAADMPNQCTSNPRLSGG